MEKKDPKEINIKIKAVAGSGFQGFLMSRGLETYLRVCKAHYEMSHKKNQFNYTIKTKQ